MSLKRINKEIQDFAASPPVGGAELRPSEDDQSKCIIRLPLLGQVLELHCRCPPDYPFRAVRVSLPGAKKGGAQRMFADRLRLVCPELLCWRVDASDPLPLSFYHLTVGIVLKVFV